MSAGARLGPVGLAPATEIIDDSQTVARLAPIRINLLPHRELKREQRKKEFVNVAGLVGIAAAAAVMAGGFAINQQISGQQWRNDYIKRENEKLEAEISQIKTLREEIAALKARQQAVENLQSDRTAPVRLLDELVRLTPDGVYLRQIRQDDTRVGLVGHAQTNERVAEMLRNLAERSPLLERPELGEIKEIALPPLAGSREPRKSYEFSLNVLMRRSGPADAQKAANAPRPQAAVAQGGAR
ncbi:MAG: PilN domain-containing protein [Burkholderiales bacterium]|jgi:type IV pilus assembly protein PilN